MYFSKEAHWDLDSISACFLLLYVHMVLIIILLFSEVRCLWEPWRRKVVQLINQNLWLLNSYHSLMTPVQEFCNISLCCMFSHSILTCTDFFSTLLKFIYFVLLETLYFLKYSDSFTYWYCPSLSARVLNCSFHTYSIFLTSFPFSLH